MKEKGEERREGRKGREEEKREREEEERGGGRAGGGEKGGRERVQDGRRGRPGGRGEGRVLYCKLYGGH